MKCTSCGRSADPLSVGNGFKHSGSSPFAPQPGKEDSHAFDRQFDRLSGEISDIKCLLKKQKLKLIAIASAICAAVFLITLLSVNLKIDREIDLLRKDIAAQNSAILSKPYSLPEASPSPDADEPVEDQPAALAFTKHPSSETDVASGDAMQFVCRVTGQSPRFSWLRYDPASGEMLPINADEHYSVSDSELESGEKQSTLNILSAGADQEGLYICAVADEGQIIYSEPVTLRLKNIPSDAEMYLPNTGNNLPDPGFDTGGTAASVSPGL